MRSQSDYIVTDVAVYSCASALPGGLQGCEGRGQQLNLALACELPTGPGGQTAKAGNRLDAEPWTGARWISPLETAPDHAGITQAVTARPLDRRTTCRTPPDANYASNLMPGHNCRAGLPSL